MENVGPKVTEESRVKFVADWESVVKVRGLAKLQNSSVRHHDSLLLLHELETTHRSLFGNLTWDRSREYMRPTSKVPHSYYEHLLYNDIVRIWKIGGVFEIGQMDNEEDLLTFSAYRWWDLFHQLNKPWFNPFEWELAAEEMRPPEPSGGYRTTVKPGRGIDEIGKRRSRRPR